MIDSKQKTLDTVTAFQGERSKRADHAEKYANI
jgi:hypothetical protein